MCHVPRQLDVVNLIYTLLEHTQMHMHPFSYNTGVINNLMNEAECGMDDKYPDYKFWLTGTLSGIGYCMYSDHLYQHLFPLSLT